MTAAFQGNAFQNDSFQMGSPGADTGTAVIQISDGNETVMILHEQDQNTDYLGTSFTTCLPDSGICLYPSVSATTTYSGTSATNPHVVTLPTYAAGDRILLIGSTVNANNVTTATTSSGNFTIARGNNDIIVLYKDMNGSEGSSVTITFQGSERLAATLYTISAGTFSNQAVAVATIASGTSTTPNPPSVITPWNEKSLVFAFAQNDGSRTFSNPPYPNGFLTANNGSANRAASCYGPENSDTFDPGTFTQSASDAWFAITVVQQGLCDGLLYPTIRLDDQDFTDRNDYGYSVEPLSEDYDGCQYPAILDSLTGSSSITGTSHTVTLPSGIVAGQRIIIVATNNINATNISFPAGWTEFSADTRISAAYRDCDGLEGSSIVITTNGSADCAWTVIRLQAETFDSTAPVGGTKTTSTSTTPDSGNLITPWGSDKTLWITAFGADDNTPATVTSYPTSYDVIQSYVASSSGGADKPYMGLAARKHLASAEDPGSFTISSSFAWHANTYAVKGICEPRVFVDDGSNNIDFTDFFDYGFASGAVVDDAAVLEDKLLGDGTGLDDQDFTDYADYGYIVDQPIDDNNPEVASSAIALDDQDFTDLSEYGYEVDPPIDDNNPDLAPSALDDQDFTDTSEYGFIQDPGAEQDHHLGTGDGLDDQDFTDLADYGSYTDPLVDDFVLREDFVLGDGQGLDTQDFTDLSDYGSSVDQLSTDHEDFILGVALDEQDFTDLADYSYTVDQLSADSVDFILGIALDDQDFTDLADYGSTTEQAIPDNDQNFRPDMVALDDQDFTDRADYGASVDPLSDDLRQDFVLGDGQGLDTQDFTDFTDYGSYTAPLVDDFIAPENFILGDGQGLDTQDFTDRADYGYVLWLTPENVTVVVVNGVDITVQVGCFHVYGFGAITDPSTVWTPASTASTTWAQVADPGTPVWTAVPNGSTSWSGVTDPADPGWEEDC